MIAGISNSGFIFAQKIANQLTTICDLKVQLCEVEVNKLQPQLPIKTSLASDAYENANLVLIDDVLNSGTTLIYALS